MSGPHSSNWCGKFIDGNELARLKQLAAEAPSKRARICLHQTHDDAIQEMLIALCDDSHVAPHRQLHKSKTYTLVEGLMTVIFYDDSGNCVRQLEMGDLGSERAFVVRFPSDQWHTVRAVSPLAVYIETITGPYRSENTQWAPWGLEQE